MNFLSPLVFAMLGDIDLIFGMWVYNDKLQIKFTFRSGRMIFGLVMALGIWNLAKYLVVTITRPKIIGAERNVNVICNWLLYTHMPNIKSISQSIAKKSGRNCFISELLTWVTLYKKWKPALLIEWVSVVDNVSEWVYMFIRWLLFQWARTIRIQLSVLV
jgi:hypothetical protein